MSDKDLEINIDVNLDKALNEAIEKVKALETAWERLSRLPTIDFGKKINTLPNVGESSASQLAYAAELDRKSKAMATSWTPKDKEAAVQRTINAKYSDDEIQRKLTYHYNNSKNMNEAAEKMLQSYKKEEEYFTRKLALNTASITKVGEPTNLKFLGGKSSYTQPNLKNGAYSEKAWGEFQAGGWKDWAGDGTGAGPYSTFNNYASGHSSALGISAATEAHREEIKSIEEGKTEVKKLSYSYDNLFAAELDLVTDKEKKEKFLNVMEEKAFKTFRYAPASETGKYHPAMMNEKGGLLLHSKAVAQASLAIAEEKGYTGNKDDLILQALGHDMAKLNPYGKSDLYGHAKKAGEYFDSVGLPSSAIRSHMYTGKGNSLMGTLKPVTEEEKILKEADQLVSRTYAQDYIKAENGNILGIDLVGLRREAVKRGDLVAAGGGNGEPPDSYVSATEESNERAKADKASEKSWHSILSSAGKFALLLKGLGIAAMYASVKATDAGSTVVQSGMSAFTGMTVTEVLDNELREKKIKAAPGSINAEQQALAEKRAEFQRTGKADLFSISMFGRIGELLLSKDPMQDVYGKMIDELIIQVKGEKSQTKREGLMGQIRKEMGPNAAKLVNFGVEQSQSYDEIGQRYAYNDTWASSAMGIDAEMQTYLNSIKNSFSQILTAFQDFAGNPVLKWVADLLHMFTSGEAKDSKRTAMDGGMVENISRMKGYQSFNNSARKKELDKAWDAFNFKGTVSQFADQAKASNVDLTGVQITYLSRIQAAVKAQLEKEREAYIQKMVDEDMKRYELEAKGKEGAMLQTRNATVNISAIFPNAVNAGEISRGVQQAAASISARNAMDNLYLGATG